MMTRLREAQELRARIYTLEDHVQQTKRSEAKAIKGLELAHYKMKEMLFYGSFEMVHHDNFTDAIKKIEKIIKEVK